MQFTQLRLVRIVGLIVTILLWSSLAGSARADTASALKAAPRGANAVMTIDVAKLIQSPFGKASELQSKLMSGYAERPLAVPATAQRVTLAAGVHPMGLESIWQVALIELSTPPRLDNIFRTQGGYSDTIDGKAAVWSKNDIYYVQLNDKTLGVVRPGQRQFVSRWISGKNDAPLSPYLSAALSAGADADAVFAVDMDGVVSPPGMRYAMTMGELPSLDQMDSAQRTKLLTALASVKGMKITVRATDKLSAEWVIEFGQNVSALGAAAKPFVSDVLTAANMNGANAEKWEFRADGNRIVGTGTMDLPGLQRLVALLGPGQLPTAAEADNEAAPQPPTDPQQAMAAASLKYYRAVAKSLDGIGQKISPTEGATWLSAQSRMLDQLPVLNVDPALLAWGGQVSEAYRHAAQELAFGQQNARNAAMGVASPTGETTYDATGESTGLDTAASRAAFQQARDDRRQAAQAQRLAAADRALNYFNQIAPMRREIRAQMTQKYGVEF